MFVDFDGTLAPIVVDPATARPHPGAREVLAALADRFAVVAVISGRPAAFLVEHVGAVGGAELRGLYGLERVGPGGTVEALPAAEEWREAVAGAAQQAEGVMAGGRVERKGLTVTLHYRTAPDQAAEVEELAGDLAHRFGLRVHPAKMSVELRPPVDVDKGTVLSELAVGLSAVAFAGDDLGDLPAFAVLAAKRAVGTTTLSIAVAGPETPAQVVSAADVTVDGPGGVLGVLWELTGGQPPV
ncbi:MAG TPA: trehalose-phosphatase [Acidimicrobiales bacterium]|nr:trehalose-phosphatase [Acidimicrobiales bacterium]